jgi:hypothetical protein
VTDLPLTPQADQLASAVAHRFAALPQVQAIALGGSQTARQADDRSDIDLYVFAEGEIAPGVREQIALEFADPARGRVEIDNRFWGPGDEWIDAASGIKADVMFFSPGWMEDQIDRALVRHEASVGYSTCFWHTVQQSCPLFDRSGWYARLKQRADQPYPEPLRRAVIAMNHPILRRNHAAYAHQIELAVLRRDRVSVNHRVAGLLASYFDILFALNRAPHPGEKRLIAHAERLSLVPSGMDGQIDALLCDIAAPWEAQHILEHIDALVDGLDVLLSAEGLI